MNIQDINELSEINDNGDLSLLMVSVYKDGDGTIDCSLDGISNRFNRVLIVCPSGNWKMSDNIAKEIPVVRVVEKDVFGRTYRYVVPTNEDGSANTRGMMGGTFVYCSDSRFRKYLSAYPLPLHDRFE
jgi:hypothetical protein